MHISYNIFFTHNFPCRCTIVKATSSCCVQLRRHVTSGHSVGNDPQVLPRGLTPSRSRCHWLCHHTASSYINTPPLASPSQWPSGATSSRSCYLYLRRHTASTYIVDNDPRVCPQGLSRAGHAIAGYVVVLPPATSTHHLHLRWHTASAYIIGNDCSNTPSSRSSRVGQVITNLYLPSGLRQAISIRSHHL